MTPEKTQLANLIKMAKADGQLHAHEQVMVFGIAHNMGFSKYDIEHIIENADEWSTVPPEDEEGRIRYMYQLLILATSDRDVSEEEVKLLQKIGGELGLSEQNVSKAVDHIVANTETDLTSLEMKAILGADLN